jgi:hypothetical protein
MEEPDHGHDEGEGPGLGLRWCVKEKWGREGGTGDWYFEGELGMSGGEAGGGGVVTVLTSAEQ